jgi:two-component system, OmpR family, sensor histidine kinase KdpD
MGKTTGSVVFPHQNRSRQVCVAVGDARVVRAAGALAIVAVATVAMNAAHANHTVAALLYVVVVVGASFLGTVPAIVAVLSAFAAQNYFFTPPRGSLRINSADDVVAFFVFGVTAAVVSAAVTRVNELRRRARVRELEARSRLELTEQLLSGAPTDEVVDTAQRTVAGLFNLRSCTIDLATGRADIVSGTRLLTASERDLIDAFARGIATSVDRVRLDREASQARVDAASQQGRAAFLSAMTHNLRTPLASIKASVSTLLAHHDLEPATRDELLTTAQSQTERLERLVSKVLHLSQIRSGAVDVQREPVDVTELVRTALHSVRALTADRTIRLDTGGAGIAVVAVDPTIVEVGLSCLIENALRYAPNDGEIVVSTALLDGECTIKVIDHGPGIPVAEREHVFAEFVRGEGVRDATGAGIGLTIARALVRGHGGEIVVEDTPGGGATFVMTLPYEDPIVEEEP